MQSMQKEDEVTTFSGLAKDTWPLPPRGISVGKTNHRAGTLTQYTYLCEHDNRCMAIAYSQVSEEHARTQVAGHTCPVMDGSRGLIPTGKTLIQKMWDEADDAMDALRADRTYKGMAGPELQGFIKGIAEVLTFCTVPCFKVTEDVLRELFKRWKMRDGQLPFTPTPSYQYNPHLDAERATSKVSSPKPEKLEKPPAKRTPKKVIDVPMDDLLPEQRKMIRESYHSGNFDEHQLAQMFNIDAVRVLAIAGPKPQQKVEDVIMPGLF